jgi:hypothetical protein
MALSTEEQMLNQLDQIRRILAIIATKGGKQRDQISRRLGGRHLHAQ